MNAIAANAALRRFGYYLRSGCFFLVRRIHSLKNHSRIVGLRRFNASVALASELDCGAKA
jgi:hypothetical protein